MLCLVQHFRDAFHLLLTASANLEGLENNDKPREMHPAAKKLAAATACLVYMTISSALIVLNQQLMHEDGFRYPMALSGLGMGFSAVASYIACKVFHVVEIKRTMTVRFYMLRIMPVGLFMALTLHFGNTVYLYLTVSFIQMLKAFTPIATMVGLFVAGLETPTKRLILAVLLIAIGTAIASYGEVNLSWIGVACMMASETFEATRLVMTQILLVGLKFHPIEGLMYLAPACFFWLMAGVVVLEWPTMSANNALQLIANKPFLYFAAAAMGFCVNLLAYMVIQTASSLTLKVLGTIKNAIVVWIGIIFLQELVTKLQGFGYAVSLLGFFLYNYIKMQQMDKPDPNRKQQYTALPQTDLQHDSNKV
ncbi:hypothetical protein ABBQ38_012274 [Trebouxia sp. C0009 RCD-2024]